MGDANTPAESVSFASFFISLGIDGAILCLLFTLFFGLRLSLPDVYAARYMSSRIDAEPQTPIQEWRDRDATINVALLKPPPANPFLLLWHVAKYTDAEVLATVGLDGYMILR